MYLGIYKRYSYVSCTKMFIFLCSMQLCRLHHTFINRKKCFSFSQVKTNHYIQRDEQTCLLQLWLKLLNQHARCQSVAGQGVSHTFTNCSANDVGQQGVTHLCHVFEDNLNSCQFDRFAPTRA